MKVVQIIPGIFVIVCNLYIGCTHILKILCCIDVSTAILMKQVYECKAGFQHVADLFCS